MFGTRPNRFPTNIITMNRQQQTSADVTERTEKGKLAIVFVVQALCLEEDKSVSYGYYDNESPIDTSYVAEERRIIQNN